MKKMVAALIVLSLILTSTFGYTAKANLFGELISTYTDVPYMFTFKCPEFVDINHTPDIDNPLLELFDSKNGLSAKISFDEIDQNVIYDARDYFGDYSSSGNAIFDNIVAYKNSLLTALAESIDKNFIYGTNDETINKPYIKIIKSYTENMYEVNSHITLYNTIEYDSTSSIEEINLNIMVPSYQNKIIYTLNFSIKNGNLNPSSITSILDILSSFEIQNHKKQTLLPEVLNDLTSINLANQSMYPGVDMSDLQYECLDNKTMGYKIKYPATFIPYKKSSFMDSLQYMSFKITDNNVFSIMAEKDDIYGNSVQNRINSLIMQNTSSNLSIAESGVESYDSFNAIYIKYIYEKNGLPFFTTEYYIKNNGMLYSIKIQSKLLTPSMKVMDEFLKILESIEFSSPMIDNSKAETYMNLYNSDQKDFGLLFPSSWTLTNLSVEGATYNSLIIKDQAISSSFNVQIYENDLIKETSYEDTVKLSTASENVYSSFFSHEVPYYIGIPIASAFIYDEGIAKIIRVENFIDENGRARICSTITITKGKKSYTLFINMSEYSLDGMQLIAPNLIPMINTIAESFTIY